VGKLHLSRLGSTTWLKETWSLYFPLPLLVAQSLDNDGIGRHLSLAVVVLLWLVATRDAASAWRWGVVEANREHGLASTKEMRPPRGGGIVRVGCLAPWWCSRLSRRRLDHHGWLPQCIGLEDLLCFWRIAGSRDEGPPWAVKICWRRGWGNPGQSGLAGDKEIEGGPADWKMSVSQCRVKVCSWFWSEPAATISASIVSSLGIFVHWMLPFLLSLLRGKPQIQCPGSDNGGIHDIPSWGHHFGVERGWRVMWYIGSISGVASSCTEFSVEMSSHV
jgi:hypothetical protein